MVTALPGACTTALSRGPPPISPTEEVAMRPHLILLAGLGAGFARSRGRWRGRRARRAITAGAAVAGLAAAGLAPAAAATAGPHAPRTDPHAPRTESMTAVRGPAATTVPLVTGGQVMVTATVGGQLSYLLRPLPGGGGAAFWSQAPGGEQYIVPAVALPYAGRELGRSLFDVSALARDGITGSARIPVSLGFAPGATVAAPPGVTLTSASGDSARGYLTAASGWLFAAALRRQTAADTAHGHLASTSRLFGGLTAMNLAAPGAPVTPRPHYPLHILQLNVTDYTGQPANNAQLVMANTDDLRREAIWVPVVNGVARVAVPAGDYFAFAYFSDGSPKRPTALRGVTVNDFKVRATSGISTLAIDERSATSAISVTTPRPAARDLMDFLLFRLDARGRPYTAGILTWNPTLPLYVNSQPAAAVGRLHYLLQWGGAPPPGGGAYRYDVAFAAGDIPADEHFAARVSQLATVHQHFSADPASATTTGSLNNGPVDAVSRVFGNPGTAAFNGQPMPGNLTQYVGTADGGQWEQTVDTPNGTFLFADRHTFTAGHHYSIAWAHGPLAPGFGQHTGPQPVAPRGQTLTTRECQACTADHTLSLVFNPAGDSEPGHVIPSLGFPGPPRPRFTLYRDGTKLSGTDGAFGSVVHNARPGRYRAVLDVDLSGVPGLSQSTRTHTDLTVRYVPGTGAVLPAGDTCPGRTVSIPCRILPALTLNYRLATGEDNTSSSQIQVLHLGAGHISYDGAGSHAPVTSAAVWVSFNGGRSWRRAAVTGPAGRYTATWPNPAAAVGTRPQIKVTASDAIGGSITQTITNAYTIGISHRRSSP
jgi:hypothetical protein